MFWLNIIGIIYVDRPILTPVSFLHSLYHNHNMTDNIMYMYICFDISV